MRARLPYVATGVVLGLLFNVGVALAWTGPTASAPNSNIAAPVNVGSSLQVKSGDLTTNSHTVYGDLKLNYGWNPTPSTITYLNFSNAQNPTAPTWGLNGYGIRDNNGTLEFKNSGGSWASLQSLISGVAGFWTASGNNISNSNSGNVGIGAASPLANLHIAGTLGLHLRSLAGSPEGGRITWLGDGTGWKMYLQARNDSGTLVGATPVMTLVDNGNVGIGTQSPDAALQVGAGSVAGIGGIQARSATASYVSAANDGNSTVAFMGSDTSAAGIFGTLSNHAIVLRTNNTDRVRITNAGSVGIGTASPSNALHVAGNIGATGWIGAGCEGACESGGGYSLMYADGNVISTASMRAPMFYDQDNTGYYIDLNGGTTGRYGMYSNGPLAMYSALSGYWGADIRAAGTYGTYIQNGSGYYSQLAYSSYGLYTNGNIYGAAFYYTSDKRLKDNVKPLDRGLMTLLKLNPVSFTWNEKAEKKSGQEDIGLIAQDVEKLVPEAVNTDEETGYKMIDYPKLVPVLIKAIQEQQNEIELLKADIKALKAAIAL